MSRAVFRAWRRMDYERLRAVVVRLEPVEISDGIDFFPAVVAAVGVDGRPAWASSALADAVWDAAVEKGVATGPVLLTLPGSGPRRVETAECSCDPWVDDGPCDACHGHGFVWWPKAAGDGAA